VTFRPLQILHRQLIARHHPGDAAPTERYCFLSGQRAEQGLDAARKMMWIVSYSHEEEPQRGSHRHATCE
jgi:hypothetical protein